MQASPDTNWDGDERRLVQRRMDERRRFGRELTDAEREREERRIGDRRRIMDRRRAELQEARVR